MQGGLNRLDVLPVTRKEVKDAVIRVLMAEWPLNAKKVFSEVKKVHDGTSTYQGVHKALKQLESQQIVLEERRQYTLNPNWVLDLKRFSADLETARIKKRLPSVLELPKYGSASIENNGVLVEPYFWMLDQSHRIWSTTGPVHATFIMRRTWPLIVMDDVKYAQFMDIFKDNDQYAISNFDRFSDRFFSKIWEKLGFKCKLGVDCAKEYETYACGDFVFQVFMPEQAWKEWDAHYARLEKDPSEVTAGQKVAFEIKTTSRFVVTRNPEFAQQIRGQAKSCFEGAAKT